MNHDLLIKSDYEGAISQREAELAYVASLGLIKSSAESSRSFGLLSWTRQFCTHLTLLLKKAIHSLNFWRSE